MPRILTDALELLRRIYGVPGQLQSPQDIEYELPIQIIHEVGQDAARARGGYMVVASDMTHAGADTQRAIQDVEAEALARGLIPPGEVDQYEFWILGASVSSNTTAQPTSAIVGVTDPTTVETAGGTFVVLSWGSGGTVPLISGGSFEAQVGHAETLPYKWNGTDSLFVTRVVSVSGAATTVQFLVRYWIGLKGAAPPPPYHSDD